MFPDARPGPEALLYAILQLQEKNQQRTAAASNAP